MLGGKNKTMAFSNDHTLISRGSEIVGDLHFSGELQVEGTIRGNVVAKEGTDAKVILADKGVVEGEIRAPSVVINGQIVGNVFSTKHVELAAKAVVEGNVHYQLIEVVKGAQVNGSLVFAQAEKAKSEAKSQEKPSKKRDDKTALEAEV